VFVGETKLHVVSTNQYILGLFTTICCFLGVFGVKNGPTVPALAHHQTDSGTVSLTLLIAKTIGDLMCAYEDNKSRFYIIIASTFFIYKKPWCIKND